MQEETLEFTFKGKALEQLAMLKDFFRLDSEMEVIKLGISFLQKTKEEDDALKKALDDER